MEHWLRGVTHRGKQSAQRKTCPSHNFSTTNPTRTDLELNPSHSWERDEQGEGRD